MTEKAQSELNSRRDIQRTNRVTTVYEEGIAAARRHFDPDRHLIGQPAAHDRSRRTYRPPQSLPYVQALLRQGDAEAVREAAAIVDAVLDSQETHPRHPHRGNFLWLADDAEVVDLNAVQFVLRALLPVLVRHGDQLPAGLIDRCRESLRLALGEEERMAVAPTYTNIHLMSLLALVVGGEWLDDSHFRDLGQQRWAEWVRFTIRSGAPHEYNSPGYGAVDLGALAELVSLVQNPLIKLQARLLYERLWLHLALHLHLPTGQLAGPHCRCYWPMMMTGRGSVKELLWLETGASWLLGPGSDGGEVSSSIPASLDLAFTEHWLPDTVRAWLEHQERALPCEVRETADLDEGFDLTIYLTPSYSLGTASRTYGIGQDDFYIEHQANYLNLHYARPGRLVGWGMMYSRYVVNDQHWGTKSAAPDRSKQMNFYDYGNFAGVQLKNKAIGLYALQPQSEEVFSLKTVVVFPRAEVLDEVWVNDRRVDVGELPQSIEVGDWLVVADGAVYVGVRPLEPSCLGKDAPVLLERGPQGELWLTIYNYRGVAKRFWDYASLHGAFWRGNLKAGFVVEVAERTEFSSATEFFTHLREAVVVDTVDPRQIRRVSYRSSGEELGLEYDLWRTEPGNRYLNRELYQPPSLAAPIACQGSSGRLEVGSARLITNPQTVWLIAQELDPAEAVWTAVNPEDRLTPLRWETPLGVVSAQSWGIGKLEWRGKPNGEATLLVDTMEEPVGLDVPSGTIVRRR